MTRTVGNRKLRRRTLLLCITLLSQFIATILAGTGHTPQSCRPPLPIDWFIFYGAYRPTLYILFFSPFPVFSFQILFSTTPTHSYPSFLPPLLPVRTRAHP